MPDYLRPFRNALEDHRRLEHLHLLMHQLINQNETLEVQMSALSDAIAQNSEDIKTLITAADNLATKYSGDPSAQDVNDAIAALAKSHQDVTAEVNKLDGDVPADSPVTAPAPADNAPAASDTPAPTSDASGEVQTPAPTQA